MKAVRSSEEFGEDLEKFAFLSSWPWERWYHNHLRRLQGKPPLRLRDVRRELLGLKH